MESRLALVRRARRMYRMLRDTYPDARCELDFENPFQLLVATVLSAQTTDVRVNSVTGPLFAEFGDAAALAGADPARLEEIIRPTGFYRAKAATLQKLGMALESEFGGEVPSRLTSLVTLPGVGRKTANVVLAEAYGVPGLTVDTHFGRLARRFGWTDDTDPVKVERTVGELFERKDWNPLNHTLIWHGRRRCHARRPACGACPIAALCPAYGEGEIDPVRAEKMVREPRR